MSDFSVTDTSAAAFAADMTSRGLDPTAALARFGFGADGTRAQPQQPAAGPTTPAPATAPAIGVLGPAKAANFTPSQTEQAADTLAKAWTGDPAVLHDALERAGLTLVDDVEDARTPAQRTLDAAFPSGNPAEFDLNGAYVGRAGDIADLARTDSEMRSLLAAMNYPTIAAKSFVTDMLDAAGAGFNALTSDAAKASYSNEQVALAIRATGATSRADLFAAAKVATDLIPAAISAKLAQQGVFENTRVLAQLYMQGQRILAYRRG